MVIHGWFIYAAVALAFCCAGTYVLERALPFLNAVLDRQRGSKDFRAENTRYSMAMRIAMIAVVCTWPFALVMALNANRAARHPHYLRG